MSTERLRRVAYEIEISLGRQHPNYSTIRAAADRLDAQDAALRDAVIELNAAHRPHSDGIGCVTCYPSDGRWPCSSSLVVDDLIAALAALDPKGAR